MTDVAKIENAVRDLEVTLAARAHPDPYKTPWMPGGSKWERNIPPPREYVTPWRYTKSGPDAPHVNE